MSADIKAWDRAVDLLRKSFEDECARVDSHKEQLECAIKEQKYHEREIAEAQESAIAYGHAIEQLQGGES